MSNRSYKEEMKQEKFIVVVSRQLQKIGVYRGNREEVVRDIEIHVDPDIGEAVRERCGKLDICEDGYARAGGCIAIVIRVG